GSKRVKNYSLSRNGIKDIQSIIESLFTLSEFINVLASEAMSEVWLTITHPLKNELKFIPKKCEFFKG
ncbi:hypothetical protein KI387_035849, partial [Taxus chinensis]